MTDNEVTRLLIAMARIEGKVQALDEKVEAHIRDAESDKTRLTRLERLCYVAMGAALTSGAVNLTALL